MAHVLPRVPADENDLLIPSRASSRLLQTIVRQAGDIRPVEEISGMQMQDEQVKKINELTRCLNTLVAVISGK